jgi:hypothetical protein
LTAVPSPILVRWYVRFSKDDAFFDPCRQFPSGAICALGFVPIGTAFHPLPPLSLAEPLPGGDVSVNSKAAVTIATLDIVGTEALLIVENKNAGPRSVRVQIVLDR